MDGSDDYDFTDDIVLDADTLAVLEEAEQKYLTQQPAKKRQRTEGGWGPGPGAFPNAGSDHDDLPEISVRGDGTYAVRSANTSNNRGKPANHQHPANKQTTSRTSALATQSTSAKSFPSYPPPATLSTSRHNKSAAQPPPASAARANALQGTSGNPPTLSTLQRQLAELQQQSARIQAALQDAIDAKLSREGEVTILRKTMEKNAREHAAQIASLQAAKEEANQKQMQLQRESRDEMERLKTQLMFKQQEFEASTRRVPTPARAKKPRDGPSTPITPWRQSGAVASATSNPPIDTPMRPRTTSTVRPRESLVPFKMPMLPGFENTFITSTPVRGTPGRRPSFKGNIYVSSQILMKEPMQLSPINSPIRSQYTHRSSQGDEDNNMLIDNVPRADVDDTGDTGPNDDMDMKMDEEDGELEISQDEFGLHVEFDARSEFHSVIISHKLSPLSQPTIQLLLAASPLPPGSKLVYISACTRLFDLVASKLEHRSLQMEIGLFCTALRPLVAALREGQLYTPLAALFNLTACLLSVVPSFLIPLISPGDSDGILDQLCDILRVELHPDKQFEEKKLLVKQVLTVVECLGLDIPDSMIPLIGSLLSDDKVLDVVLDTSQPIWVLATSCRILIRFATYSPLVRYLLAPKDAVLGPLNRLHHVDRLCTYLTDTSSHHFEELLSFKLTVLNLLAAIALSSNDAHHALLSSTVVLPSIILFMGHLTNLIWDEEESLVNNFNHTKLATKALNQVLLLLHHLVFGIQPSFNVRQKLHTNNPHRAFIHIFHVFIVTVGRLTCATPPEWMDVEDRLLCEGLLDLVRDLLFSVADGPDEEESFWAAFNVDERNAEVDEADLEAQLLSSGN